MRTRVGGSCVLKGWRGLASVPEIGRKEGNIVIGAASGMVTASRGTSLFPRGTKDAGARWLTNLSSTALRASLMLAIQGLVPTNDIVGVGISPIIVSPLAPCRTRW